MMHPTLQYGSRGGVVRALQHLLNEVEGTHLGHTRDGIFGPRTRAAVMRFQTQKRLEVDGIVGPHSWAALGRALRLNDLAASASKAAAAQPKPAAPAAMPFAQPRISASRVMPIPPAAPVAPKPTVSSPPRPVRQVATAPHLSADLGGGSGDPSWYQIALAEYQAHHTISEMPTATGAYTSTSSRPRAIQQWGRERLGVRLSLTGVCTRRA